MAVETAASQVALTGADLEVVASEEDSAPPPLLGIMMP
jgi:hypothetical protein